MTRLQQIAEAALPRLTLIAAKIVHELRARESMAADFDIHADLVATMVAVRLSFPSGKPPTNSELQAIISPLLCGLVSAALDHIPAQRSLH